MQLMRKTSGETEPMVRAIAWLLWTWLLIFCAIEIKFP
jgi:hypothetical protein